MKTNFRLARLAAAIGAFALSGAANANIIDLFTDPAIQVVSDVLNVGDSANSFSEVGSFTTIVGGYRDLQANATSGADDINGNGLKDVGEDGTVLRVSGGNLTFNNDTGVVGTGTVQWDGLDNSIGLNTTGLGELDFINQEGCPAGGCDRFVFEVVQADQGFLFDVGVWTDATHFTVFSLISSGLPGTSEFLFSDFTNAGLCGLTNLPGGIASVTCGSDGVVDFTKVGAMQAVLNSGVPGTIAVDLEIGAITKQGVPEPATLALLGIGLVGLGMARRKNIA